MGSKLLEKGEPTTYTEIFREALPNYIALGMSYDEFYRADPMLAKYYRKADEIRLQRNNFEYWLQAKYFDEVLATELSNLFLKKGAKPRMFRNQPYDFNALDEEEKKRKEEIQAEAWMRNFVNMYK